MSTGRELCISLLLFKVNYHFAVRPVTSARCRSDFTVLSITAAVVEVELC